MSMLSKNQLKEMIQHYNTRTTEDITDTFKDMLVKRFREL